MGFYKRSFFSAEPYPFHLCYCNKNKAVENMVKDGKARLVLRHPPVKKKSNFYLHTPLLFRKNQGSMSLEVLILKVGALPVMLSSVRWQFGQKETALVFNLVFSSDKAKEAVGKSTGEADVGKSLPPNCQENHQPIFQGERFKSEELGIINNSARRRSSGGR